MIHAVRSKQCKQVRERAKIFSLCEPTRKYSQYPLPLNHNYSPGIGLLGYAPFIVGGAFVYTTHCYAQHTRCVV